MTLTGKDQRICRKISTVIYFPQLIPCIPESKPGLRVDGAVNKSPSHATPETM